ncbi:MULTISPECIES: VOC family protein [Actinokineospora]|uniref:Glyoxalase n=1 Tax=Actinokineospora fastidiosa TaxID=1816 RepID=A0A918GM16_9PSEU|nr:MULTISPECIES: VOC family protein [Actinokineospora]UVS77276.1 putative enzyme related to lactoylglutathione lyase [Actinokineospora sp. UTMC 2448]GGS44420.1 glyoxalase [Actinokineospora fastidiosa]
MRARLDQLVIDCLEPAVLARFWAGLLGGDVVDRASGWSHTDPPGFPRLAFQPVPDPRTTKNRLHLDVEVDDIRAAAETAVGLGAQRMGGLMSDAKGSFQVMRDPEGNEFCFVSPP